MSDANSASDDDVPNAISPGTKNKLSKSLSRKKGSIRGMLKKYLMKCNRSSGIVVLHTGLSSKAKITTGGPAIAALGSSRICLEAFLKGVLQRDARCFKLLEEFADEADVQPVEPTEGFFEWAEKDRIILPDQVPKLKAALLTYLADDGGKQGQPKGRSTHVGKGAKTQLQTHVSGMRAQMEAVETATAPTMHAQLQEGEATLGVAPVAGLTATFDSMFEQIGYNVNQPLPYARRRHRTVVHDDKLPSR